MRHFLTAIILGLAAVPAQAQPACGDPAAECTIAYGFYRLAMPADVTGPVPAVVFLHGWGGSSEGVMRNKAMLAALSARGYALIAPESVRNSPKYKQRDWSVRDGSQYERDDLAFLAAALDDTATHGVDRDRVLMTGFSRGASMVWDVACHTPDAVRAYAPIAGAFWEPLPKACEGPVDLFQTHGWTDKVVPLEGRSVAGGRLTQGDAFARLHILRNANGCDPQMPDTAPLDKEGDLRFRNWTHCPGGRIDLMLHPGGHSVPEGWLDQPLDWFEARLDQG